MEQSVKRCTKCKQEYLANAEYFFKDSHKKDGLSSACKVCIKAESNERYALKHPKIERYLNGMKQCITCENYYEPTSEFFGKRKDSPDGLRSDCKKCRKEYRRNYYINNKEKTSAMCQEYYAKNVTSIQQKNRAWREKNILKVREYSSVWVNRRRARKLKLPDSFSVKDWDFCLLFWGGCCAYCGKVIQETPNKDHFIPLVSEMCTGTIPTNILPACKSCNSSKIYKDPEDWIFEKFGEGKGFLILEKIMNYFDKVSI